MKKWIGVIFVLLVLLLAGYYISGRITQRAIEKNVISLKNNQKLDITLQSYKRGWFCSKAILAWKVELPSSAAETASQNNHSGTIETKQYVVDVPVAIHHGPVIFADGGVHFALGYARTKLSLPEKYNSEFDALFVKGSVQPQLSVAVKVGYLRGSSLAVNVPKFLLEMKENSGRIIWDGMHSKTNINVDGSHIIGSLSLSGLEMLKLPSQIELRKLNTAYQLQKSPVGLYIGHMSANLGRLTAKKNDVAQFELDDFSINTNSQIVDDKFDYNLQASFQKLLVAGAEYKAANLQVSLRNLEVQSLLDMQNTLNKTQLQSDNHKQQLMFVVLSRLPQLLSKGAVFEINDLEVNSPDGLLKGMLAVSLPEGAQGNPISLVTQIQGHAKFAIPKSLVRDVTLESMKMRAEKQSQQVNDNPSQPSLTVHTNNISSQSATEMTDKQLKSWVDSGVLVEKDNQYILELNLANGHMTVNGKPFSADMLAH